MGRWALGLVEAGFSFGTAYANGLWHSLPMESDPCLKDEWAVYVKEHKVGTQ